MIRECVHTCKAREVVYNVSSRLPWAVFEDNGKIQVDKIEHSVHS
jgi:hypothetical protein